MRQEPSPLCLTVAFNTFITTAWNKHSETERVFTNRFENTNSQVATSGNNGVKTDSRLSLTICLQYR